MHSKRLINYARRRFGWEAGGGGGGGGVKSSEEKMRIDIFVPGPSGSLSDTECPAFLK